MTKTVLEKVYFRVCFEGMTDRAREFWAAKRPAVQEDKAKDWLDTSGNRQ